MTQMLRRLGPLDWAIVAVGLAIVLCLEVVKPAPFWAKAPAEVQTVEAAFAKWTASAEGAAAFAVGPEEAFGWSDNHADAATARRFALAYCRKWAKGPCHITAERDQSVLHPGIGQVVSPKTARAFEKFKSYPGAKAFAINEDGYFGYFYRAKTQFDARKGAIAQCEAYKGGYPDGVPPLPCRIVFVSG